MKVHIVNTESLFEDFLNVPFLIYKHDDKWIAPLKEEVRQIFDSKKNYLAQKDNYQCWVVEKNGEIVGRIAAFINEQYINKGDEGKMGGFGFFECIEDEIPAFLLLNVAKEWLEQKECVGMDGPINLGERNKFWGLLISGFHAPLYGMNYNPLYYKVFFEKFGLQIFYEQYCYKINIKDWKQERIATLLQRIQQNKNYEVRCLDKSNIEKFAKDFCNIYNEAWQVHEGNKVINEEETIKNFNLLKPFIDVNIIFFVYFKNEPIAFFINLPDINYYLKLAKGRLTWWSKLRVFIKMKLFFNPNIVGLVYGVKSQFQNKGIDAFLISGLYYTFNKSKYKTYEMQWIGEFNVKMCKFVEQIHFKKNRTLATYRLFFNSKYLFQKHPSI